MSQDGFPNEDGEQMTPELLLLQERQRASEWPKVIASFLDMQSLEILYSVTYTGNKEQMVLAFFDCV